MMSLESFCSYMEEIVKKYKDTKKKSYEFVTEYKIT